jgi:hypothetical protein
LSILAKIIEFFQKVTIFCPDRKVLKLKIATFCKIANYPDFTTLTTGELSNLANPFRKLGLPTIASKGTCSQIGALSIIIHRYTQLKATVFYHMYEYFSGSVFRNLW